MKNKEDDDTSSLGRHENGGASHDPPGLLTIFAGHA